MPTVYDVPPNVLIEKVSKELMSRYDITPPPWTPFVKTGVHKERSPDNPDWWYVRCAALLRRLYVDGPVGVSRLRTKYGGKQRRGSKPERFRKGSGSIIRKALQQLEKAGLVQKTPRGRSISNLGMSLLDNLADNIIKENPELAKLG